MPDATCLGVFITQFQNGQEQVRDARILQFGGSSDCRALIKQLCFQAVAKHPARVGQPVRVTVNVVPGDRIAPQVQLDLWSQERPPSLLTSVRLSAEHFTWVLAPAAQALQDQEGCKIRMGALARDSPLVQAFAPSADQDDAMALVEQAEEVSLPAKDLFTMQPVGPRRLLRARGTWLKAVFTPDTFRQLREAACQPALETEIGFFGGVRVHLTEDSGCRMVIERLYETPAEAGKVSMKISGARVYQMHRQVERLGAWIHTHPAQLGNLALTPTPSDADIAVAVQIEDITRLPVVFPIAMSPMLSEDDLDAYGFVDNLFCPLDLEVLT